MVNLIIADDHVVLRQALCEMLQSRKNFHVLAQASDGEQLLNLLAQHKPDLVIMDLAMPQIDGIKALERMNEAGCSIPVLVLSANEGERNVRAALKAGAKGFLPKHVALDELVFAIESILQGRTYLSPSITATVMGGSGDGAVQNPLSVLTKREVEILTHLAEGKPNRSIGKLLHISTRTVDTHRSNILRKLNAKTNADLVRIAIAHGLVNL